MKKIFSLILLLSCFAIATSAQSTSPRFGTTANSDNSGRVITYGYSTQTFANTLYQLPHNSVTYIKVGTLTHALSDTISVIQSRICDEVTLMFTADTLTAGRVVTFTGAAKSAGTFTIAASKSGNITFLFNGQYWIEKSRAKQ